MMTIQRLIISVLLLCYLTLTACKISHPILAREPIDQSNTDDLAVQSSLLAHTTRGCWQSMTHSVPNNDRQPSTFILAAGANVGQLIFSDQDARQFAQAMQNHFKVPGQQVCLLQGVYRVEFEQALRDLKRRVKPNDRVIIFFSGAGAYVRDDNGDEPDQVDEVLITLDVQDSKHPDRQDVVTDDNLVRLINQLPTERVMTFIDAGYEGSRHPENQERSNQARHKFYAKGEIGTFSLPRDRMERAGGLEQIKGDVFSAARESQNAYEMKQGGVFTHSFLKILTRYPDASLTQVFEYTQAEMRKIRP
ncbi:MAG TPA: hypothetical protein DCM38_13970 [Gammaproteobacteria bacterium]|nr:hypothetical protein [Candidatus Parabeggiatoa sp.]HAI70531.1 hypothetical protein [Gammaproteobacteria bacterium]